MGLDLSALRGALHGTVITPYDSGYEGARALFNTRIRTRPAILCRCADTDDVATAIRFAREAELPVAVRGGGHHASGLSLVEGGLVIDVGGLHGVAFDPGTGTATVGAGIGWRGIDRVTYVDFEVDGHGYAAAGGDCPTVSNAGYSLGGGYGLLGRRFGLGCDHILEAELVDADAKVHTVTEAAHPDLLWALRGAGGAGFGVVTRLTYRLNLVPKTILTGAAAWPLDQAQDVFRAYRDLYVGRDDDRLAIFLVLLTEPYPDGEPVLMAHGLYAGDPAEGEAALAPLRAIGRPLFDGFGPTSYYDFMHALGQEIVYGLQNRWTGGYFRDGGFDDEAFATMVDAFRRLPSGYCMLRFDLLGGGAIGRVPVEATAFAHRASLFYASIIAQWSRDEDTAANVAWADDLAAALRPHLTGEVYQNYADSELADWPRAYYGSNYARLQQVKQRYDPTDFFHHAQSIRLP